MKQCDITDATLICLSSLTIRANIYIWPTTGCWQFLLSGVTGLPVGPDDPVMSLHKTVDIWFSQTSQS